jgi:hypothetical protein
MFANTPPILWLVLGVTLAVIFIDDFVKEYSPSRSWRSTYWICLGLFALVWAGIAVDDPHGLGGAFYLMIFAGTPLMAGWTLSRAARAASNIVFRR